MKSLMRSLMLVVLCGVIALNCAFYGKCGPAPTPCDNPPCATPTPDPAAQKAKALKYARAIANSFRIVTPLIAKNNPAEEAKLNHLTSSADKLIDAVANDNNTEIVALLADIMPQFTAIVDEYTSNTAIQIALVLADEALNFFADEFVNAVSQPGVMKVVAPNAKTQAQAQTILHFRDGSHLRVRDKRTGRFVSAEYAQSHPSEVYIEKTKPKQ